MFPPPLLALLAPLAEAGRAGLVSIQQHQLTSTTPLISCQACSYLVSPAHPPFHDRVLFHSFIPLLLTSSSLPPSSPLIPLSSILRPFIHHLRLSRPSICPPSSPRSTSSRPLSFRHLSAPQRALHHTILTPNTPYFILSSVSNPPLLTPPLLPFSSPPGFTRCSRLSSMPFISASTNNFFMQRKTNKGLSNG